MTSTFVLFLAL